MANVSSSNGLEKRPKLRFPGFDEPWEEKKLDELLSPRVEKQIPSEDAPLMAFTAEGGVEPKGERYDRSYLVKSDDKLYKRTEFNDFIYSSNNLDVGSIGLNKYGTAVISDVYEIFRIKPNNSPTFMSELIQRPHNIAEILKYRQGCLYGQYRIYAEDFLNVSVLVPTRTEQEKVSQFLDALDHRIEHQSSLIKALKKYKRGLNKRILSLLNESCHCKLGSVCTILGGGTPDTLKAEYWGNSIEWFTPSEIGKTKYVSSSVRKLSNEGMNNSSAKLLPIGTVLLTTRATLGEMSIAKKECCTNQGFQSLIPHTDRISTEYLYYMQIIIKPWCEKYASGNTFREISKAALSDCIIPVPERAKQEEIVKLLSSVDSLISVEEKKSFSLTTMRDGLLQQLFI